MQWQRALRAGSPSSPVVLAHHLFFTIRQSADHTRELKLNLPTHAASLGRHFRLVERSVLKED